MEHVYKDWNDLDLQKKKKNQLNIFFQIVVKILKSKLLTFFFFEAQVSLS